MKRAILFVITFITIATISAQNNNLHKAWDNISNSTTINKFSNQTATFIVKNGEIFIEDATVTLGNYGERNTDIDGKAIFTEISSEENINYTVSSTLYRLYHDSITVTDQDITEYVQLEPLTYSVTFTIKNGETLFEGASVILGNYGTILTGIDGNAIFTNVVPSDSIYYEVIATGYNKITGKVTVTNSDVTKTVNLSTALYTVKFLVTIGSTLIENAEVDFSSYGIKQTNANGEATFLGVTPEFGLQYKVTIPSYSPYESALNVIDANVVEEVKFSLPSYSVLFTVKSGDRFLKGATISLENYGEKDTDNNGNARFINVEKNSNLSYTVRALWHEDYPGTIVVPHDISVFVAMTDVPEVKLESLTIWPNPSNGEININFPEKGYLQIISSTGKVIYSDNVYHGNFIYQIQNNEVELFLIQFSSYKRQITNKIVIN